MFGAIAALLMIVGTAPSRIRNEPGVGYRLALLAPGLGVLHPDPQSR